MPPQICLVIQTICAGGALLFWSLWIYQCVGCAINPQSQSQVVFHRMETRDLPRQQATTLSVMFGQHSVEPALCHLDICKKSNQGGLFFQLRDSNRQVEGPSYLFDTITIFLKVVLGTPTHHGGFPCHKEP